MRDDAVVARSRVQMLSLMAIGTPWSGPERPARSRAAARSSALSAATRLKACSVGSWRSIRSSAARQASTADSLPPAIACRVPVTVRSACVHQPITRGTRNSPASTAASGAWASTRRGRSTGAARRAVERRVR
jgi:hypothetical protein